MFFPQALAARYQYVRLNDFVEPCLNDISISGQTTFNCALLKNQNKYKYQSQTCIFYIDKQCADNLMIFSFARHMTHILPCSTAQI